MEGLSFNDQQASKHEKKRVKNEHNVHRWMGCEWLERLTANATVATVLGSILAFSETMESEGRQI